MCNNIDGIPFKINEMGAVQKEWNIPCKLK